MTIKDIWNAAKAAVRGNFIYNDTILLQKTRKPPNEQPNITHKATREIRTSKTLSLQKERNHKDQC